MGRKTRMKRRMRQINGDNKNRNGKQNTQKEQMSGM